MLEVRPFRAWRYDFARHPEISALIAPPYDVLEQADKDALLGKSDRNIVAVDLPHVPPKSAGPASAYAAAADRLKSWQREGTLVREAQPALYLYHQNFAHEGRSYTRKMFIAALRLVPFSEGCVLPHEETFGGPKEDRLALMKATACNLSPIFGLYSDPRGEVDSGFAEIARRAPDARGSLDGVENRLWIVTDAGVVRAVTTAMTGRKVFIADGHHRYGTALMYRDVVIRGKGALDREHPANFIMFVLASMDDPGCLILPYNRVLAKVDVAGLLAAWSGRVEPCDESTADLRLFEGSSGKTTCVRFTHRALLDRLASDHGPAWRKLDVAYLHRVLIDDALHAKRGKDDPKVHYVKSVEAAKETARVERGTAILLNATPMAHLKAVSEAGELMPQKSTYFHPKLATGMTINPLD